MALLAAALLAGCGTGQPDAPRPTSIVPASGSQVVPVAVRIRGEGFGARVGSDFSGDGSVVDARFQAFLGETPLDDVALQQDGAIAATVPVGMAPGTYDLTVVGPEGRAGGLAQAYTVRAPETPAVVTAFRLEPVGPQVVRQPFAVVVTAVDASGAEVPDYAGTVALSDVTGTAVPREVGLFSGGRWTGMVELRAATADDALTVTDASGATGRSAPFVVAPAPAAAARFVTAGRAAAAGECAGPVTLSLSDAFGQPTVAAVDTALAVAGAPADGFGLFSDAACAAPLLAPVVAADQAATSVWFAATRAGALRLSAGVGPLWAAQSWSVAAGPPAALAVRSDSQAVTAGACSAGVTVEVRDAYGNLSLAGVPAIDLAASPSPGLELFSDDCTIPAPSLAVPAGAATAVFHFRGRRAGRVTVSASAPGLAGASLDHDVGAAAASDLAFVTAPRTTAAGACSAALTVEATDRFGNAAAGASERPLSLSAVPGPGFEFHGDPQCGGVPSGSARIPAGASTATFYARGTARGDVNVAASSPGLATAAQTVRVDPGPPAALAFASAPRTARVNGCSDAVELRVVDAFGNPSAPASPLSVAVVAAPAAVAALFADAACTVPAAGATVPAGSETGSFHFSASQVGALVLTASAPALAGASQTQTVTAAAPDHLAFVTSPQAVAAGACSGPLTIEAQDAWGNPLVLSTTAATTVALAGADLTFHAGAGCGGGSGVAFAAGATRATFSLRRTVAGTGPVLVTATAGSLTGSQTETVVAGAADHLAWAAIASPQQAGEPFAVSLSARDACGNAAPYAGTATLSASAGTVSCASSCTTAAVTAAFTSGSWSGEVSVPSAASGLTLAAAGTGPGGPAGASNAFDVQDPGPAPRSPPLAAFTATPRVVVSGNSVAFDAGASSDRQTAQAALEVSWDFDATSSADHASAATPPARPWTAPWTTAKTASHAYLNHGTAPVIYRPRLAVRDREAAAGGPDVGYAAGLVVVLPSGEDLCTVNSSSLADDGANGCFGPGPDGRLSLAEAVRLANAPERTRPLNITFAAPLVVTATAATVTLTRPARILGIPGVVLDGVSLDLASDDVLVAGLELRHLATPITIRGQWAGDVRLEDVAVRDGAGILVDGGTALLSGVRMSGCAGACVREGGTRAYLAIFGSDFEGAGGDTGVAVERCAVAADGSTGSSPYDAWTLAGWMATGAAFVGASVFTGFDTAVSLPARELCRGPLIRNVTFDRNRIGIHAEGAGGLGELSDSLFTRQTASAADACGFAAVERVAAWNNASPGCLTPDVTADPRYVWMGGRDLRLQEASPLRDAGSAAHDVELDGAGPGLFLGARPDRGGRETY